MEWIGKEYKYAGLLVNSAELFSKNTIYTPSHNHIYSPLPSQMNIIF